MARRLIAGGVLAALWLAFGLGPYFLQFVSGTAATLARMIPSPMRGGFFGLPTGWAVTVHVLAVVLIVLVYVVVTTWFARASRASFAAGWIAAVLTGLVVGGVLDLGEVVGSILLFGVRGAISTTGAAALAVFWALVVGWIPALIVSRGTDAAHPAAARSAAVGGGDPDGAAQPAGDAAPGEGDPVHPTAAATAPAASDDLPRPPALMALTVMAAVVALALPIAAQSAHTAAQAALQQTQAEEQAQAEQNADPNGAAPRDPDAEGTPVPTVAPSADPVPADACTAENTTMMAPPSDAATGHRLQPLQIVNVGEAPCTLDGYPDVAFGDQNEHLLPVTTAYGSSFMATDPGAALVTLKPGEAAQSAIGWDANSENGQLAARTLWAAPVAGTSRSSWDVVLDVVAGTTVHITAWQTGVPAAG